MARVHSKSSRLVLGTRSFSGDLSSWEHSTDRELADVTVHTDSGHTFIPGLDAGQLSLEGRFDNTEAAGSQDATLNTALGASAGSIVTAGPDGLAVGKRVINIEARESNYAISSAVADAVGFSASWMSEGQIDVGVSLHDLSAETTDGDGASVDNAASSSGGGIGSLQATAFSGLTNNIVKIQHSTDDSVWVDLITFTTITAATSERSTVAGTVNRYLRSTWNVTGTGSNTFTTAFSRR